MKLTDDELQALVKYFELLMEIDKSQTSVND